MKSSHFNRDTTFGYQFECLQIKIEGRRQSYMVTHLAAVTRAEFFPSVMAFSSKELLGLNLLPPPHVHTTLNCLANLSSLSLESQTSLL